MKWPWSKKHVPEPAMQPGQSVHIGGGYDMDAKWLGGSEGYNGVVDRFIPGQDEAPAMVVKLADPISVNGVTGHILVLELRYAGAQWEDMATVHVELCPFDPEDKRWQDRRQGKWVESHATIRLGRYTDSGR
jgi:hypothetical protein